MLSNIVSTAAGVGIGHAIGHSLTGMFGGSSTPAEGQQAAAAPVDQATQQRTDPCNADAKAFQNCMQDYRGDVQICKWYLDQLQVCPPNDVG
jgi:hypothetical protein